MKKNLLLIVIGISSFVQAQLNNRRLIVPEFGNNTVKTYVPTSSTTMAVDPNYTITFSTLGNGLATSASPNCVTMNGTDLYVSLTNANQRIYKFPNYGANPVSAVANVSQITGLASDYVGIAFDASGNLYASEGSYPNTQIVKYTSPISNLSVRTVLGNGGIQSYFGNIAFDTFGNLWASDYLNNRLVAIPVASLNTVNAQMKSLTNASATWNATGTNLANTNPSLSVIATNYAFTSPEGVAFDSTGGLWVANNNDGGNSGGLINTATTLVRISPALQTTILGASSTQASLSFLNAANGLKVWNLPNSGAGRPQLGGLQIDKVTDRIYVNEQKSNSGMYFDIATINAITSTFSTYQLSMVSSSVGNGGIYLASNTQVLKNSDFNNNSIKISFYPNPSNGNFNIITSERIKTTQIFDIVGKEIEFENITNTNFRLNNPTSGMYFMKIIFENGNQFTKKILID
jgi:Secretion system C-terminal sorting domain